MSVKGNGMRRPMVVRSKAGQAAMCEAHRHLTLNGGAPGIPPRRTVGRAGRAAGGSGRPGARGRLRELWDARARRLPREGGMVTSEYAMGLVAVAGLAAVLYKVLTSSWMRGVLQGAVEKAFDGTF
ncbi:DUF4244 domain-containing protein [Streptomyces sp. NPDC050560]|uniref:DUF4244 domain-containing protein n=1 Tax=Streptomyces sp. NPDC050560 TaxID=3365630 RepID=UPI0037B1F313